MAVLGLGGERTAGAGFGRGGRGILARRAAAHVAAPASATSNSWVRSKARGKGVQVRMELQSVGPWDDVCHIIIIMF